MTTSNAKYESLWNELKRVAHEAYANATPPTPMIVGTPTTPLGNDIDYSKQTWYVADGVCGFASVVLDSGRSGFAKWLVANGYAGKHWVVGLGYRGISFWANSRDGFPETRQSLQLKEQVCGAIARHLQSKGISAWVESRID